MNLTQWKETLDNGFVEVPNRKLPSFRKEKDLIEHTFYYPGPLIDCFLKKLHAFTIDKATYRVVNFQRLTDEQIVFVITYQNLTLSILLSIKLTPSGSRFNCYYFLTHDGARDFDIDEGTRETIALVYQDMISFVQEYSPNRLHFQVYKCDYREPIHQEWR